jgi:predicted NBD/HSP70 family sugar kinase
VTEPVWYDLASSPVPAPRTSWTPRTAARHPVALEILLHGPVSRRELARRLDLSPASPVFGLQRFVAYEECLDLALQGDAVATAVATESGRALGRLVAAVANLTLARKIVLTGEGIRLALVAQDAVATAIQTYVLGRRSRTRLAN